MDDLKTRLDELLVKYKAEPVGWGYIDCLILNDDLSGFANELGVLGIRINAFTVWCHCTDENKIRYGCPHGLGGPKSKYHDGWFSELCDGPFFELVENKQIIDMVFNELPKKSWYSPCMVSAPWLDVPEGWRSIK